MGLANFVYALALASPAIVAANPIQGRAAETITKTGFAHPMTLTPVATIAATQTPLSYASPKPKPITYHPAGESSQIKSNFAKYPEDDDDDTFEADAAAKPTCTKITGSYPLTTLPAFCHPSLLVNAPSTVSGSSSLPPHATATLAAASNKLECCAHCASIYNCFAWQFVPVFVGEPSPAQPGGFDPWGQGSCEALYHTGDESSSTTATKTTPASCPNGVLGNLLQGSNNEDGKGQEKTWENLYYNGWNQGQCGAPKQVFRKAYRDAGKGEGLCPGQ